MRAESSGISLTEEDAAIVKGMLARGDRQHDIAAWFGVNGGRIGEISSGNKFEHVHPQTDDLPPPGPYTSGKNIHEIKKKLLELKSSLSKITSEIDEEASKL